MTPPYVVPGRYVLMAVHIRDPNVPAQRDTEADPSYPTIGRLADGSHDGHTICGRLMRAEEQWVPFDPQHLGRERICPDCQTGGATHVQEALI